MPGRQGAGISLTLFADLTRARVPAHPPVALMLPHHEAANIPDRGYCSNLLTGLGSNHQMPKTAGKDAEAMIDTNLSRYENILRAKQAEIETQLRMLDRIAIESAADELDNVQMAGDREMAITTLDRTSLLMADIRRALARIEDGTYGICQNCEEEINPKRLRAVPWTPYCLHCQEAADRHGANGVVRGWEALVGHLE